MWAKIRMATPNMKTRLIPADRQIVKFDRSSRYIVALDQSTSCTGVAIFKLGTGITMVMEIERHLVDRDSYVHYLIKYLEEMLSDVPLLAVLIEDVFEGNSPGTYKILNNLAKGIERMCKRNVSISGRIERILNQVWVATFLQDIQLRNKHTRATAKALTQEVSLTHYPWATDFKEDAYDAIGILHSYIDACYNSDTSLTTPRLINTFIQSKGNHKFAYEIIADNKPLTELGQIVFAQGNQIVPVRYNTSLTPEANARLATEVYRAPVVSEPITKSSWTALFAMLNSVQDIDNTQYRMIALNTAKQIKRDNFFDSLEYYEV